LVGDDFTEHGAIFDLDTASFDGVGDGGQV
jgi:hypothetical protein